MNRKAQFVAVLAAAVALASLGSHLLIGWLKIETKTGEPWMVGEPTGRPRAFMAGSSLAGDGIAWRRVAAELNQPIGGWGVAGASPYEMEAFQGRMPEVRTTFIVISAYDMNEENLSDFRADVVGPRHAISELVASRADWRYSKRVLSQYFVRWLRALFPTIGRSQGVMGELRTKIVRLREVPANESEAGPSLDLGEATSEKAYKNARVTDWAPGTVIRKVEAIRGAFQGEQAFGGLKYRALQRMLRRAHENGTALVVVLPASPIYTQKFLTPSVQQRFERSLSDLRLSVPEVRWVRLDQLPALASNDHFWDLVHMNASGQAIATQALLSALRQTERP